MGNIGRVLRGDDDRIDPHGRVAVILDRDLALGVGSQPADRPVLPQLGDLVNDPVGQGDRQGHQFGGLVAGVPEHHPLVAGPNILALLGILVHTLGDIGRLLAQRHHHGAGRRVEAHLARGVADLAHNLADDRRIVDHRLGGDLAGQANQSRGQQALARHPAVRVLGRGWHRECRRKSGRPSCRDGPSRPIRW